MTSSPCPIPRALSDNRRASVPELHEIAYFDPSASLNLFSRLITFGPIIYCPDSRTLLILDLICGDIFLYCLFKSKSFILFIIFWIYHLQLSEHSFHQSQLQEVFPYPCMITQNFQFLLSKNQIYHSYVLYDCRDQKIFFGF